MAPAPSSDEEKAIDATGRIKERKEHFTFEMADIPVGAKLHFADKPEVEVEMVDEKNHRPVRGARLRHIHLGDPTQRGQILGTRDSLVGV